MPSFLGMIYAALKIEACEVTNHFHHIFQNEVCLEARKWTSNNAVSPGPTVGRLLCTTTCPTVGHVLRPTTRLTVGSPLTVTSM